MKKIILMFILSVPTFLFSQKSDENNTSRILKEDFKFPYNHPEKGNLGFYVKKEIKLKDGADKDVIVKINSGPIKEELLNKVNFCCFDINIKYLLSRTMSNLKNKYTFIPREIYIYYVELDNSWEISVSYSAQNDFGALKDGYNKMKF